MKVSFVIPTRNEEGYLPRALSSIDAQEGDFEKEIIVVDGGSSDGTLKIAGGLADKILTGVKGRGNARDAGARQSNGDFIVFLDADTFLAENFLYSMIDFMGKNELAAASCLFKMSGIRSKFIEYTCNYLLMRGEEPLLPGFATVVRSKDYMNSTGFKDVLGEDLEFSNRIVSKGKTAILREKLVRTSSRRISSMGISGTALYYATKDLGRRANVRESKVKNSRFLNSLLG